MKRVQEDYQFILSINKKGQVNTISSTCFDLNDGLREDINEAADDVVELIYDNILSKEREYKVAKDYDASFIFSLYNKKELVTEIEYMLPDNRTYSNVNIDGIIPDIINFLRVKELV
jgi:asparagine synthetase A